MDLKKLQELNITLNAPIEAVLQYILTSTKQFRNDRKLAYLSIIQDPLNYSRDIYTTQFFPEIEQQIKNAGLEMDTGAPTYFTKYGTAFTFRDEDSRSEFLTGLENVLSEQTLQQKELPTNYKLGNVRLYDTLLFKIVQGKTKPRNGRDSLPYVCLEFAAPALDSRYVQGATSDRKLIYSDVFKLADRK
jgi:hypothetical protein